MNKDIVTVTDSFLYSIGVIKKQKENFLSDVVRAICYYNECFLNEFFNFCFPKKEEVKAYSIDRETTCFSENKKTKNGRNDFKIYTTDGVYIVESKILDKNISKYTLYLENLNITKDKIVYIISNKNAEYHSIKRELKSDCIACECWEDFIEKIKSKYKDFALIASTILDSSIIEEKKKKPQIGNMTEEKNLCDDFFHNYLENEHYDKKGGDENEWNCKGGYAYGYSIWASVWFGLIWEPLKGCFWSFAYGEGGNKDIKNKSSFKYIKPLGKYMNDKFFYYEIKHEDSRMTLEILKEAFLEFADIIEVYEKGKTPLVDYLKKYGAQISRE